jgi:hypothetical protein
LQTPILAPIAGGRFFLQQIVIHPSYPGGFGGTNGHVVVIG